MNVNYWLLLKDVMFTDGASPSSFKVCDIIEQAYGDDAMLTVCH